MGIGEDIRDVLKEVGSAYTILRDSGNVEGEYCELEVNRQITKPFIFSYFRSATLQDNTQAVAGDIFSFENTGNKFLLMAFNEEEFENDTIVKEAVLYKCNVSGELQRPTGEAWNAQYHKEPEWDLIKSDCHALLTEAFFGHSLETDENVGHISLKALELYVPHSVGVQVNDRYQSASGEYFRIEVIKDRKFAGVDTCGLAEDTR